MTDPRDDQTIRDHDSHLGGAVRSALDVLADGFERARHVGEKVVQAGEKVAHESTELLGKVKDEGADVLGKVKDEGAHLADKLRPEAAKSGSGDPAATDTRRERAHEAFDIAKTVAAAVLVGTVKAVQLAHREWRAHTGNASTPEDHAEPQSAWDAADAAQTEATAQTDQSSAPDAGSAPADAWAEATDDVNDEATGAEADETSAIVPEINDWDAVEAEVEAESADVTGTDGGAAATAEAAATSDEATSDEATSDEAPAADDAPINEGATEPEPETEPTIIVESPVVTDELVYSSESQEFDDGADTPLEELAEVVDASASADDDAPLAGFSSMTIGSLRGHLGSMDLTQLEELRDYERAHQARPQVLTMLDNRIAKVTAQGEHS